MQRLTHIFTIALLIFAANASGTVLMDEIVSNDAVVNSTGQSSGVVHAVQTRPAKMDSQIEAGAALITPVNGYVRDGYVRSGNSIDPEAIIQERIASKTASKNETFLLLIAVIGLVLFIMRRRSGD
jgi:hypothetical protein